jgi:hypothetical protein
LWRLKKGNIDTMKQCRSVGGEADARAVDRSLADGFSANPLLKESPEALALIPFRKLPGGSGDSLADRTGRRMFPFEGIRRACQNYYH